MSCSFFAVSLRSLPAIQWGMPAATPCLSSFTMDSDPEKKSRGDDTPSSAVHEIEHEASGTSGGLQRQLASRHIAMIAYVDRPSILSALLRLTIYISLGGIVGTWTSTAGCATLILHEEGSGLFVGTANGLAYVRPAANAAQAYCRCGSRGGPAGLVMGYWLVVRLHSLASPGQGSPHRLPGRSGMARHDRAGRASLATSDCAVHPSLQSGTHQQSLAGRWTYYSCRKVRRSQPGFRDGLVHILGALSFSAACLLIVVQGLLPGLAPRLSLRAGRRRNLGDILADTIHPAVWIASAVRAPGAWMAMLLLTSTDTAGAKRLCELRRGETVSDPVQAFVCGLVSSSAMAKRSSGQLVGAPRARSIEALRTRGRLCAIKGACTGVA